jgi:hypothetical protein|tara:strand:- start:13171 stop:13563 length:393 start_codon:yes stop_codon:yes gene_type:complete
MEVSDYSNELLERDEKIIEHYVWIDMFIMVWLWVVGTFTVTKLSMRLFDPLNTQRTFFNMLFNVSGQLFFISTLLFAYKEYIFEVLVQYLRFRKDENITNDLILTSSAIGITIGINLPTFISKMNSVIRF